MNTASRSSVNNAERKPTTQATSILQRQCANCGVHTSAGHCNECSKKKLRLQTKLTINQPGDRYEQEADRIADQVMAMPSHSAIQSSPIKIQRLSSASTTDNEFSPTSVERVISSPGRPLEPTLRADMEQRFGYDFSHVRVHTGSMAEQSARDVNALAYTSKNNIVFGDGKYRPTSHLGRHLIAHELTHVIQQQSENNFSLQRSELLSTASICASEDRASLPQQLYDAENNNNFHIQRTIDPVAAAGLGVATFQMLGSLVSAGSSGLQWSRNIASAIHAWPPNSQPPVNEWNVFNYRRVLLIDCKHWDGMVGDEAEFDLHWNYNGADIDQAHAVKRWSSDWEGTYGSVLSVDFRLQDASPSYEEGGKAAMLCYIDGVLDPWGWGDIDFSYRVIIFSDGTMRNLGYTISRGSERDFTFMIDAYEGLIVTKLYSTAEEERQRTLEERRRRRLRESYRSR